MKSHILSMVVYSMLVAVVMAVIRRRDTAGRIRYGLILFAVMTLGSLLFGWLMSLFL